MSGAALYADLVRHGLLLLLGITTVISVAVAVLAWHYRSKQGALALTVLMLAGAWWALAAALVAESSTPAAVWFWSNARYVGIVVIPVAWFAFTLEYVDHRKWITRRTIPAFAAVPALTLCAVWTNPLHGLFYAERTVMGVGPFLQQETTPGILFWVHLTYSYGLILVGTVFLGRRLLRAEHIYRGQALALVLFTLSTWVANVVDITMNPLVNPTPIGIAFSGVIMFWALLRYRLLDLLPIARDRVLEEMDDGIIVVDTADRIVDLNPAAERILGRPTADLLTRPLESVLANYRTVGSAEGRGSNGARNAGGASAGGPGGTTVADGGAAASSHDPRDGDPGDRGGTSAGPVDGATLLRVDEGGTQRLFELRSTPLADDRTRPLGRLVLLRDVTEWKEYERRLEAQNERLEAFAGVVSHDLRNPLNVAQGYVELARETGDADAFDAAERALDRMEGIVADVLTLSRDGEVARTTETVTLRNVVDEAWATVDTHGARLVAEAGCDTTWLADRVRLLRVLENLFRNAAEHGSTSDGARADGAAGRSDRGVTVTVGLLDSADGFYVEDDGPGIDPEARTEVFAMGHSGRSDGTGLGLAIVRQLVRAHGWEVAVVEGSTGGARFEISGVERV